MSGLSDIVMRMLDAGCDRELIADMLDYVDQRIAGAQAASVPSKGAERTRRWREKQKASQNVTGDVTGDDHSSLKDPDPKLTTVQDNPNPPPPYSPPAARKSRSQDDVRAELSAVLSPDRVDAVIAHRQKLRKPMTAHAARLLAGKFARIAKPDDGADAMVANGWIGFEPDWMNRGQPQRAPPRQANPSWSDLARSFAEEERNGQPAHHAPNEPAAGSGFDRGARNHPSLFERDGMGSESAGPIVDVEFSRSEH